MIAYDLYKYLNDNLTLIAPLQFPYLTEDDESIALRQLQEIPEETVYMSGTSIGSFPFEIIVKVAKTDSVKAIEELNKITDKLQADRNKLVQIKLTDQEYFTVKVLGGASNIGVDEHSTIWSAMYQLEYTKYIN